MGMKLKHKGTLPDKVMLKRNIEFIELLDLYLPIFSSRVQNKTVNL